MKPLEDLENYCLDYFPKIEAYIKDNEKYIKQLPKLYFLAYGKNGYIGQYQLYYRLKRIPIIYESERTFFVDAESFRLYNYDYFIKDNKQKLFLIAKILEKGLINFQQQCKYLKKEINTPNTSLCVRTLQDFIEDSMNYNIDITYEDYQTFYQGRKEPFCNFSEEEFKKTIIEYKVAKTIDSLTK